MSKPVKSILGTGWGFPPSFTKGGADVHLVSDEEDIIQSLQIILSTGLQERFLLEKFGSNLNAFLFEEIDQTLINIIRTTVTEAITYHEARIELDEVDISNSNETTGLLNIQVTFRIVSTNSRFNMVFPFYIDEGNG